MMTQGASRKPLIVGQKLDFESLSHSLRDSDPLIPNPYSLNPELYTLNPNPKP